MEQDVEMVGAVLACIPSGCSILTVQHGGSTTGLLVSWIQQASFDPPSISACIKQGRAVEALIDGAQRFLVNIIGDDPTEMFKHFGKGFSLEEDAFAGLDTRTTEFGPLIESCIAHMGCRVTHKVSAGDHNLYVAEVVAGGIVDGAKPYTHRRKSGLSY